MSHDNHSHGNENVTRFLLRTAYVLELLVSICLILAILVSLVPIAKQLFGLVAEGGDVEGFESLLANLFTLVIGIEFLKMLCSYNLDSVIEVLLFTLARGIVLLHPTALEQLLSISSIAILFLIRRFLFVKQLDGAHTGLPLFSKHGDKKETAGDND